MLKMIDAGKAPMSSPTRATPYANFHPPLRNSADRAGDARLGKHLCKDDSSAGLVKRLDQSLRPSTASLRTSKIGIPQKSTRTVRLLLFPYILAYEIATSTASH